MNYTALLNYVGTLARALTKVLYAQHTDLP
jgi:hypothetical protein